MILKGKIFFNSFLIIKKLKRFFFLIFKRFLFVSSFHWKVRKFLPFTNLLLFGPFQAFSEWNKAKGDAKNIKDLKREDLPIPLLLRVWESFYEHFKNLCTHREGRGFECKDPGRGFLHNPFPLIFRSFSLVYSPCLLCLFSFSPLVLNQTKIEGIYTPKRQNKRTS